MRLRLRSLISPRSVVRSGIVPLACVAAVCSVATAEESGAPQAGALEEIVVTAQKRSESLTSVPIAISVIGGEALQNAGIANAESLGTLVPSLTFKKGTTNVNSTLNLRGIGTQSFSAGAEPSVSTVVDGVVMARSGMAFSEFNDLERIEVLRGPQGTLFGKNASAGVLNIVTKEPSDTFDGSATLSLMDREEYRASLSLSGPLSESVAARISAFGGSYDGNVKNVFDDSYVNGYERYGVRAKVLFNITPDVDLTVIGDYTNSKDDCCADVIGFYNPSAALTNLLLPSLAPAVPGPENMEVDNDLQPATEDTSGGLSAQLDVRLGEYTLTSITAARQWDNKEWRDGDFHADAARYVNALDRRLHDFGDLEFKQYTQELRLASPTGEFFDYVVGVFVYHTEQDNTFTRSVLDCTASTLPADATGFQPCQAGLSTFVTTVGTAGFTTEFDNAAVFGQSNFHLSDRWRLLAGLRYTQDEVSYEFSRVATPGAGPGIAASFASRGAVDEDDFSYKVGSQFDVSQDAMAYLSYARGYKGPAFNVFFNMGANNIAPIAPETSDAYEIGFKSDLLDRRLRLNLAVFRADYSGFQTNSFLNVNGTIVTSLTNAGDVRTQGAEADIVFAPTDSLTLTASAAYTDATIEDYFCPPGLSPAQLAACVAHNGKPLPYAPEWKGNIGVDWRLPIEELPFDVRLQTSYAWTDDINFDIDQNPLAVQESYGLWDAAVAFGSKDERYTVSLLAKNISDEFYTTFITPTGAATAAGTFQRNQIPRDAERYYGISLRMNFGQ